MKISSNSSMVYHTMSFWKVQQTVNQYYIIYVEQFSELSNNILDLFTKLWKD